MILASLGIALGALFIVFFKAAMPKKIDSNSAPTGAQNFVEMSIEFVEDNVQSLFGSVKNTLIAPLASNQPRNNRTL